MTDMYKNVVSRSLVTVVFACLALFLSSCLAPPWKRIDFDDTGFYTMMPSEPRAFDKDYKSAFGSFTVRFKALAFKYISFTMSVSDFPEEYVKASTVDTILISARDGAINEVQGTLVSEDPYSINNLPGREILYTFGDGDSKRTARARIFLAGTKLFQAHVAALDSANMKADVTKFLDSITMTKEYPLVASTEAQWNELVSKPGKFKVLAVGAPIFKDKSEENTEQSCYYFNSGGSSFALSWVDVEKERLENSTPEKLLNEFMTVTLDRFSTKSLHAKKVERNGLKGLEFSFNASHQKQGYVSRCCFYIEGQRVYQLAVTSPSTLADTADIETFIQSFQTLK